MCQIDWSAISIVFATLVGPILAVWASEWRQNRRSSLDRKEWVFRTLMATRSATLAPVHIEALNLVDVLFHNGTPQDRRVVDHWKMYLAHLQDRNYPQETWGARKSDLLLELLYEMGMALGYSFDRSHIKNGTYYPEGYANNEQDHIQTRKLWLAILKNEKSLNIHINNEQNR